MMADEVTTDLTKSDIEDTKKVETCNPCSYNEKSTVAKKFCKECEEYLCTECISVHMSLKATRAHILLDLDKLSEERSLAVLNITNTQETKSKPCEPCSINGNISTAYHYCKECEECLCSPCVSVHASLKATRNHTPVDITHICFETEQSSTDKTSNLCEPCSVKHKTSYANNFCQICEEMLCDNCTIAHLSSKATKSHVPVDISQMKEKLTEQCEPCQSTGKHSLATKFCEECEEKLCDSCTETHKSQKATKTHIPINMEDREMSCQRKCDPCCQNGKEMAAAMYCSMCKEAYCITCTNSHTRRPITKGHTLISVENARDTQKKCEPCLNNGKTSTALFFCNECEECLCEMCNKSHKSQKATRNHKLLDIKDIPAIEINACDPCNENKQIVVAIMFCPECEELLCDACFKTHKSQKATRNHEIIEVSKMKKDDVFLCDLCKVEELSVIAFRFCKDCKEYFCDGCCKRHMHQKVTRDHQIVSVQEANGDKETCEPCFALQKSMEAISFCEECDEYLCAACCKQHRAQKSSRSHSLISVSEAVEIKSAKPHNLCEPCKYQSINKNASAFCCTCEEPELMCEDCAKKHTTQKRTRSHEISRDLDRYRDIMHQKEKLKATEKENNQSATITKSGYNDQSIHNANKEEEPKLQDIPGKPSECDVNADSVTLRWDPSPSFTKSDYYQIRYKDVDNNGKWKFHQEEHDTARATLTDMKANTKFIFQVRVVHEDVEGPYGPQSDVIMTVNSPATRFVEFSTKMKEKDPPTPPSRYSLPVTENRSARNEIAKTAKYDIGSPPMVAITEKTIMLVGATGSGKSTLVDGIVNYILGVNWADPFRFSVIKLEDEESERLKNQALSQTEWITCYGVNPEKGSRLRYRLTIIDTPGFGDTRGLKRDQQIVEQIRKLFSEKGERGVTCIDAVCFLVKAPDARLTATQTYIFHAIMSLFGQDIEQNICSLVTFADGVDPPVLAALQESKLPFGKAFTFNNSGLFAKNADIGSSSLSPMFWDMGCKSFCAFFEHIEKLQTRSLQLTKEVLDERQKLEVTIQSLQPQVNAGLSKLKEIKVELALFEQYKTEIEANKNFEYEVTETQQVKTELAKGVHVTNCLHCHMTCHNNCVYANDEEKARCCAIDKTGYCTICPEKCHWKQHHNMPYILDFVSVTKKKTYQEMLEKYQNAEGKRMTREKVIEKMTEELHDLSDGIEFLMAEVKECNERLKVIALRPNPLSMKEHIDLMISAEQLEQKDGFMDRISMLQEFRQKAEIGSHVEHLREEVNKTNQTVESSTNVKAKKTTGFSIMKFLKLR